MDDVWHCADCPIAIHRHPDPGHQSQAWTEQFIADHMATHAAQLAEHDGDREALRHRLNHPARYAALAQIGKPDVQPGSNVDRKAAMRLGLDYAGDRPGGAAIAAAGYNFAVRYLSDGGPSLPGKLLTPDEADDLRANGIDIVSNWETTSTRMLDGYSAGAADAEAALAQALNCGGRTDRPIYFSADWDEAPEQQPAIDAYLRGAGSVLLPANVGIYGGFWPVSRALDAGTASWAWQTDAWSGGNIDPRINLHQRIQFDMVAGVQCDVNEALTTDFGQWSALATPQGGDMQLTDTITDAYGGTVTVADILKWISFHADLTIDSLGGVGSRIALPPEQKNPGHPALGGDDVVKALARIGQALHIPGYDPTKAE